MTRKLIKMKYQISVQPTLEPITLAEAKSHLRIDGSDEDTYITAIISSARAYCEQYCNRAFLTQTWKQYPKDFSNGMKLSINKVQSVSSITYYDIDGALQTLASNQYQVDLSDDVCRIYEAVDVDFPDVEDERINPITITYVAGYGATTSTIPTDIIHAVKLMVSHLFQNREMINTGVGISSQIEIPKVVKALLNNHRIFYEA